MSRATLLNLSRLINTDVCPKNRKWKFISYTINEHIFYSTRFIRLAKSSKCLCYIQTRSFINLFLPPNGGNNKKIYRDRKLIGYSPDQMFDVIQDTENYKIFLPFCLQSTVISKEKDRAKTYLEIGFPPIIESYISHITFHRPNVIKAECRDGKLFKYLITQWNCDPGLNDNPNTCVISFYLSYEFKSQFHSTVASVFFDKLANQMEQAFFNEANRRYGKPCIKAQKLKLLPNY